MPWAFWAIGQTDRFTAAVIGAPLTNLVPQIGTSDIGYAMCWLEYDGDSPEIRGWLLCQSPVWHMRKAVTPTLLLHPEDDQRLPIEQSKQLCEGTMRAGVTTPFDGYSGQPHLIPW
jgi:dipeptidyl aminopeptidase/acylaminoacyl peptidase